MVSQAFQLEEFFRRLELWGLTDVMLPFLLVFTILYAVLQKTKLLGEHKNNLNLIFALVMSLSFVIPHVTNSYPGGWDPIDIMNKALPAFSITAIAVIMLLILIGLFGHDVVFLGAALPGWIAFLSFMTILLIFGSAAGWWASGFNGWLGDFFGEDAIAIIIMLLVFGIIIAFITGDSGESEARSSMKRMGVDFGKLFGGGGGGGH